MEYTYFPGCSQEGTNIGYGISILPVAKELGVELKELPDWNCCGATIYPAVYDISFYCIGGRDLALAERYKRDLVTPCNACYATLSKVNHYIQEEKDIREKVNSALSVANLRCEGKVKVRHILDVFINDVGTERIAPKVVKPLSGLRVAPYYGCLIVRPYADFDDPDYPVSLDNLLIALGADVVDYPVKTKCCGASLITTREDVCLRMIHPLLSTAVRNEADMIVTTCPMCNFNLEAYQGKINKAFDANFNIPVLPFTQLMGVALGIDKKALALDKAIISPEKVLEKFI